MAQTQDYLAEFRALSTNDQQKLLGYNTMIVDESPVNVGPGMMLQAFVTKWMTSFKKRGQTPWIHGVTRFESSHETICVALRVPITEGVIKGNDLSMFIMHRCNFRMRADGKWEVRWSGSDSSPGKEFARIRITSTTDPEVAREFYARQGDYRFTRCRGEVAATGTLREVIYREAVLPPSERRPIQVGDVVIAVRGPITAQWWEGFGVPLTEERTNVWLITQFVDSSTNAKLPVGIDGTGSQPTQILSSQPRGE